MPSQTVPRNWIWSERLGDYAVLATLRLAMQPRGVKGQAPLSLPTKEIVRGSILVGFMGADSRLSTALALGSKPEDSDYAGCGGNSLAASGVKQQWPRFGCATRIDQFWQPSSEVEGAGEYQMARGSIYAALPRVLA